MSDSSDEAVVKIPEALERAEVHLYFRQFQNPAVLKKLAHSGTGPLYQLIGKKAWYETADIIAWLNNRKRNGPPRPEAEKPTSTGIPAPSRKRRGRPTKAAQRKRALALANET